MSRAVNRTELISFSVEEFSRLMNLVDSIPPEQRIQGGVNGEWSVKDVLAHLHAWHRLFFTWYEVGMSGGKPAIPADGYSFQQTPALNEILYQQFRNWDEEAVLQALKASAEKIDTIIQHHTEDELFTKKKYAWTGSTSLGAYLISATASHYRWAYDLIRKWKKTLG